MKQIKRCVAAVVCAVFACTAAIPAVAAETSQEKEEVVYIMADAGGSVQSVEVVNIFSGGDITDYGEYSSVKMLTSTDDITQSGDTVTFSSEDNRVYYQGTMDGAEIPWDISIRYFLDGTEYPVSELAGKSGALEIRFSVTENKSCTGTYFDDYALQASFTLDTHLHGNIIADGATEANIGSDKQLSYIVLPGKGIETSIYTDVTDFEMEAVTVNGMKLNLNVEIEDEELMERVRELMDATEKLNDGAKEFGSGTDELQAGGATLIDGISELHSGESELDSGIATLQSGITAMQTALDTLYSQSGTLTGGSSSVLSALQTIQGSLNTLSVSADSLAELTAASSAIKQGIGDLYEGIGALQGSTGYGAYIESLWAGNAEAIQSLSGQAGVLQSAIAELQNIPGCEAQAASLQALEGNLQYSINVLYGNNAALDGMQGSLSGLSGGLETLSAGVATLQSNYEAFDAALTDLTGMLGSMTVKLSEMTAGINQLVSEYSALHAGIGEYTQGVAAIVSSYQQLVGGVSSLAYGSKNLLEGSGSLSSGAAELYSGITALCDGASELADGTYELYTETADLDTQVQDEIDSLLTSIQGDETETVSFASPKNTDVSSVQFTIKTAEIKIPEEAQEEMEPEKSPGFWEKLTQLFTRPE